MKEFAKRSLSMFLALVLCFGLISLATPMEADAATYTYNWGTRGVTATYLSTAAQNFYSSNGTSYEELAVLTGSSNVNTVPSSQLYKELQDLMDRSCVEWIYIKGVPHLAKRFYSHLLNTDPVISGRAGKSANFEEDDETKVLNENMRKMQESGGLYYHMKIKTKLQIKDSAFEPGKKVRVHVPIPAAAGNMRNIKILATSPKAIMLSDVSHPQRTAYFEEVMTENHPFYVEYEYDCIAMYNELDAAKVTASRNEFDT